MIRVVFDTNVLVSALIKVQGAEARAAGLVSAGQLLPCVSAPIVAEYRRVFSHVELRSLDPGRVRSLLDLLEAVSIKVQPRHRLTVSPHEPDNRFLECAEEAEADFLITGNKRTFPSSGRRRGSSMRESFWKRLPPGRRINDRC